jgi:hypothetical protein
MAKSQKHSGLHKHLHDTGVLESGDSELIAKVRAAYWRRYHKEYKREKREKEKEYVVSLSGTEQKIMERQAAGHGQSLTAFIKGAAWAYVHQAYMQPDRAEMGHIGQVLSLCYSGIESLMDSGQYDPGELGKALLTITAIDEKLNAISSKPPNLEQAIRKALAEKPYYIITLKKLVEDYDHQEQGEEEHKVS